MDFLYGTVEILASFIECLLIPSTVIAACGTKHDKKKNLCILLTFAFIYTFYVALMNSWTSFSFITPIVGILMTIIVTGKALSNGSIIQRSVFCIIALFVIQSVDYIIYISIALLHGSPRDLFFASLEPGVSRICYLTLDKGCDIALFCIFRKHLKRISKLRNSVMVVLLVCTVMSYGIMQYLFAIVLNGNYIQLQGALLISFIILPCFLIILIFLMITITTSEEEKATNRMLENMNHMMETNYYILNESIMNNAKAMHDFHHHLSVIHTLAQNGKSPQVSEYVQSLLATSFAPTQLCRCGNDIVDAVINSKLSEANQKGIQVRYSIQINDLLSFEQADICAILSNQIENAFDACVGDSREHKVQIDIQQKENFVLFTVTNTAVENPFLANASLLSTKGDSIATHGLGLRNIRDIANRYNGSLKNEYVNGNFISTVLLCSRTD